MLPMQGVAAQGLPHSIPPEASADYSPTGWESGLERDGSEVYVYTAGEDDMLVIRINEVLYDEPNDDLPPDDPEYWDVNKRYSTWRGECRLYGNPEEERTQELFQLAQSTRTEPGNRHRESNVAFIYAAAIDSADEVILDLLLKTPESWLHEALTHPGAVWQRWIKSYQGVAGTMWI